MIRMQDLEANITHDSSNLLPESALHGKEFDAYHGNPEEGPVREREKGLLLHCRAGKMQTERTNAIMNPDQSSFHQTWKMYRVFFALLGILIVSHTHSTKSRSRQHSKSRESRAVMNAASMVYYAPSLFLNFSVGLTWISSPIRSVNLFFPAAIPGDSAIVASIRNNDLDQLQDLLSAGTASIFDTITPYGYTMLTMAMSYGHMEMSRFLRSINAPAISLAHLYSGDAVYYFFRDYTLIHNSIPAGTIIQDSEGICFSHQQVNTIIQHHLQDEETYSSLSHLQKAILQGSPESTCKALAVTRDEDIDTSDACEHTALHFAVLMNDLEGVRLLIARGADVRTQDTLGRCPLHIASCLGHVEACSTLLNAGCPHDTADISGLSPLHHAAMRGQVDIINILIDHGADINAGNDGGEPPITCAVVADQVDAIRTLLARGANLQVQDDWGCNHILNAVMLDKHEALKVLIELDSSGQDAVQYDGKTLLHLAASNSDLRTIEILCETLNIDVDVEARDSKGFTALEYVMARNDARDIEDAFQSLLQRVSANRSF
jgi:ankyrin repeat protein